MLKGIDISKWQGLVNFDAIKTDRQFAIIRSSYGTGYTDAQFTRNRDEARRVNMLLGYYHYAYPNNNTPEAEAEWFLKVVGTPRVGEVLVLDFEESYPDPVTWCLKFLDKISSLLGGYKAMIYLNQSQLKSFDWSKIIAKNHGLWLAQYDYNPNGTPVKTPWPVVAMRQYSNGDPKKTKETVPGVSGPCDTNVFYGDENNFKSYGIKGNTPTPAPEPTQPIEKLPKDQVLKDIYTALCGGFSEEEIQWRLKSGKNLVEVITDICNGDERFKTKWINPNMPAPTPAPEPTPPAETITDENQPILVNGQVKTLKEINKVIADLQLRAGRDVKVEVILKGKGWAIIKYVQIKQLYA